LYTWQQSKNMWQQFCDRFLKWPLLTVSRSFMNVLWRIAIILKANKVNLFVSSVLFVFWYHSPNFLDTPCTLSDHIKGIHCWSKWPVYSTEEKSWWPQTLKIIVRHKQL
jgi:hypothetical protein